MLIIIPFFEDLFSLRLVGLQILLVIMVGYSFREGLSGWVRLREKKSELGELREREVVMTMSESVCC